jgi:hypothetical protein
MSGWMGSLFGSRRSTQENARDAIVGLRQQLLMLEKKEDFLQQKIDDETKKARANATSNKRCTSGWSIVAKGAVLVGIAKQDRKGEKHG